MRTDRPESHIEPQYFTLNAERARFGKRWLCALAVRLGRRLPIAQELAAVYDGQRRVA